mmetsp:Transcript_19122/g.60644  ORF Transcript_19122/g.60644 Transcript_19122/m.60644 type:complete len:264 (-) Transcript_19122:60-851(-)
MLRRTQVLAEGENVNPSCSHVAHGLLDLVHRLTKAEHDRRLCVEVRCCLLSVLQHAHGLLVVCSPVAHVGLQALNSLHVVGVYIKATVGQALHRSQIPSEVRDEALDQELRLQCLHHLHCARKVTRAPIGKIVAVHAGNNHVVHTPLRDCLGHVHGLVLIRWGRSGLGVDGAKFAPSRARVPEDHDGARASVPALANVWALRLLAHGVEVEAVDRFAQVLKARVGAAGCRDVEPTGARWHGPSNAGDGELIHRRRAEACAGDR